MIRLSAAIIAFNEEKNIGRCIESLLPVADEILVLDSFSNDKTEEICKSYGVRFERMAFKGHVEQKNHAISLAPHDHIISLDADEALSDELAVSIKQIKANWQSDAYQMNRLTSYCGKWIRHGGWYPDRKIRIFRRGTGQWGGENPHDRFMPDNPSAAMFIKGDILHYSYYTIEGHLEQVNKFTTIAAQSAFKAGRRSSWLNILFNPKIKFLKDYFFRFGFMDGYYGLVIAAISAHATFIKYIKLKELQKNN
ncbi:MAG: glycosyltransferase family 2 protein [Bacteroidetes bacterium]|nr:MAG: glycosyltransferase family 2 protein [Bacteroidota bacterium]